MKWIERFKEKVSQTAFSPTSPWARLSEDGLFSRPRDELEQDFRCAWEDFRFTTSEKEKEKAMEVAISLFCKVARQNSDPARLTLSLVDVRSYAFVVARALVTELTKLRQNAPNGQLQPDGILGFFTGSQVEFSLEFHESKVMMLCATVVIPHCVLLIQLTEMPTPSEWCIKKQLQREGMTDDRFEHAVNGAWGFGF